jgi:hypothetical protein
MHNMQVLSAEDALNGVRGFQITYKNRKMMLM